METRRDMRLPLGVVVGLLALVGIGASATHYLQEPYNPGFLRFPTIVALHVVLGGVYLALAPFQFVGRIRSWHLGYHRWVGRLLVAVGLVVGLTALFMGLVIPFSGWGSRRSSASSAVCSSSPSSRASSTSGLGGWSCTVSG